jgi:hypothetical protein
MNDTLSTKKLPLAVLLLAVALMALGVSVWRGLAALQPPAGRDIAVHPGMYNLREEMQKPRDPNRRRGADGPLPPANTASRGTTP